MKTTKPPSEPIGHATVPIASLSPSPRNYRKHPDTQLDRLCASLARFGQVRSIVIQAQGDGAYLIVAGHGVVEAAQRLGMDTLHADVLPASWSASAVEAYLVADNMGGAEDDLVVLAQLLEEQRAAGEPLESLGYNAAELDQLLADLADAVPDFLPASEDEQGALDVKAPITCPQCGHAFSPT